MHEPCLEISAALRKFADLKIPVQIEYHPGLMMTFKLGYGGNGHQDYYLSDSLIDGVGWLVSAAMEFYPSMMLEDTPDNGQSLNDWPSGWIERSLYAGTLFRRMELSEELIGC